VICLTMPEQHGQFEQGGTVTVELPAAACLALAP